MNSRKETVLRMYSRGPIYFGMATRCKEHKSLKNGSENNKNKKRDDYIEDWDTYFYEISKTVKRKSKDHKCPVGAVIVSRDRIVISTGYNGLARHVYDNPALYAHEEEKLRWMCHAELNAIVNAARTGVSLTGSTIYVTKFPCFNCCNVIVQSGIDRVFTLDDHFWNDDPDEDEDHSLTFTLLAATGLRICAPNHPRFNSSPHVNGNGKPHSSNGKDHSSKAHKKA